MVIAFLRKHWNSRSVQMNMGLRPWLMMATMAACAVTCPAQFGKPNQNEQLKLGKRAAQEIRIKEHALPASDPRVQTVRRVAAKLLRTFDDKDKPWEYSFDVIESKDVNAFALPGGPMFVFTGLLDKVKTEDELAGVLGHELTHVRREHWAYQYRDEQNRNLGLTVLLTVLRANSDMANLASLGTDLLVSLPYSRGHESEADDGGFEMMMEAGYNPQGMVDLFKTLKQTNGGKIPEFLNDHPADDSRIARMQKKIDSSKLSFPPQRPLDVDYYKKWTRY